MIGKAFGVGLLCLTVCVASAPAQSKNQTNGRGVLNDWTVKEVARQDLGAGTDRVFRVRVGSHPGYDRVVFEFGAGAPNYWVYYQKPPVRLYSGEEVKGIRGNAFLEVSLSPVIYSEKNYNTPVERLKRGQNPLRTRLVSDVWSLGWFEGELIYAVGLRERRFFRVQVFSNPDRLVIDFRKQGAPSLYKRSPIVLFPKNYDCRPCALVIECAPNSHVPLFWSERSGWRSHELRGLV
jgi:hypothetical protein